MTKGIITAILFLLAMQAFGQKHDVPHAVDTVVSGNDTIVLFSNKHWEYKSSLDFDGITNHELHDIVMNDSDFMFHTHWMTEMPYTNNNNLSELNDTLWLCSVDSAFNEFCIPHKGLLMSPFKYRGSRFHHGVDIDLKKGDTVRSAFAGKVRYAKYNEGGYGNLVIVRHWNGLETYYAHLSKINVIVNQDVAAGELLGLGGKTGRAYGEHLHFEVRFYDNALDPEMIFDFKEKTLKDENLIVHSGLFDYKAISSRKKGSSSSRTSSGSSSSKPVDKNAKYHKIRSGDSLWSISRKYGTSIDALCKINGISKSTILKVGRTLKIR